MDHKVKDGKSYGYYLVQGRALMHLNRMCGHNIYKKNVTSQLLLIRPWQKKIAETEVLNYGKWFIVINSIV